MAVAEIHYENGRDKMPGAQQQQADESAAARAIAFWRDLGLVWKGIGGALALGVLLWNLGAFAIPFRIAALEKSDATMQADVKQLKIDVKAIQIDMSAMSADLKALSGGLQGFKSEVMAEIRAGAADTRAALAENRGTVQTAAAPPAAARRPPGQARKQAAVKPALQSAKWLPF